jgi:hypothetical protein
VNALGKKGEITLDERFEAEKLGWTLEGMMGFK